MQNLVLMGLAGSRDEIKLGAQRGQLTRLRKVIKPLADTGPKLLAMLAAPFDAEIVDQAADAGELSEQLCLFVSRFKLEAKAATDHNAHIQVGVEDGNISHNALKFEGEGMLSIRLTPI
jgi:hypothetical protein